jgi:hypothetical protein
MSAPAAARSRRLDAALVPVLAALVEGAMIAVFDAAVAAMEGTRPLGPLPFALAAGAALLLVRHAPDRTTNYAGLAAFYVLAVVGAGFLGGGVPGSDGALGSFAQSSAIFGAVAVFRGSRHVDAPDDDLVVGSLLQWGFPLLALPWLYGATLAGPARSAFVTAAFPATLLFGTAGLFALGLARLDALTASSGLDWRRNRPWLVLLVGVLLAMTVIAVPAAFLLGTPITTLAGGLLGPLAFVLAPFAEVGRRAIEFVFFLLTPLINFLQDMVRQRAAEQPPVQIGPGGSPIPHLVGQSGEPSTAGAILLSILLLVAAFAILALLLRWGYARPTAHRGPDEPLEEREYRLPGMAFRRPSLGLPRRAPRPGSASEAYLAFLSVLAQRPDLARAPSEPPATHAARLREGGFDDARAARLAADYQLERYALREVSERERRRALARWAALRDLVRRGGRRT